MQEKKPLQSDSVVHNAVGYVLDENSLHFVEYLWLQWCIETSSLKVVQFKIVEQTVTVNVANLEYSDERFFAIISEL